MRFYKATIIQYVGETCRYLLSVPQSPLDRQHQVRLAYGNGLRPDVWKQFKKRFNISTVFEFYAATEGPAAIWNYSNNDFSAGAIAYYGSINQYLIGSKLAIIALEQPSNTASKEAVASFSSSNSPGAHGETPYRDPKTGFCRNVPHNFPGELLIKLNPDNIRESFQGYFRNDHATSSKILRDVFQPGDAWFRTGDLVRADKWGRYYFSDRIGDTFRWKAENVSTMEVSEIIGALPFIADVSVYGVALPGHDGRCGCAAVVLKDVSTGELHKAGQRTNQTYAGEELLEIAQHVARNLPQYARPVFLRICDSIQATGTNKHVKHKLRSQGVDPNLVFASDNSTDKLYWLKGSRYVPFNEVNWQELCNGKVKL